MEAHNLVQSRFNWLWAVKLAGFINIEVILLNLTLQSMGTSICEAFNLKGNAGNDILSGNRKRSNHAWKVSMGTGWKYTGGSSGPNTGPFYNNDYYSHYLNYQYPHSFSNHDSGSHSYSWYC